MRAALLGLASAAVLAVSPSVNAQVGQTLTPGKPIQIAGRSGGQALTYSFLLDHFEARNGRVFAVGALSGGNLSQAGQVAIPLRNGNQGRGGSRGPGGGDDDVRGGFGALEHGGLSRPALFKGSSQSSLFQSDVTPLIVPAQATCPVLDLVLAAVRVNVLGLVIDLDQVALNIVAQPGALLGDLLCAVLGLLNGLDLNAVVAGLVANLLNAVVAALAGLGL
jgi:hypothetical protein